MNLEKRQRRAKMIADARALVDGADKERRVLSTEEQQRFDKLMADAEAMKADYEREERLERIEAEAKLPARPEFRGRTTTALADAPPPDGLADQVVLERGQRLEDWTRARTMMPDYDTRGLSFGALMRALVTGAKSDPERRALAEGVDSAGGYTVPMTYSAEYIDKLRNKAACFQAGAVMVPLESQKLSIARLTGDPTCSWKSENAVLSDTNITFDRVLFTAQTLMAIVKVSGELLEDSLNANNALTNALTAAMALELDRAALFGSGVAPEPLGLVNTSGIGTVTVGSGNGAALTNYDPLLDSLSVLASANAAAPTAAVMAPRTQIALSKLKDSQNRYLDPPRALAGLPFIATNQIPINQTVGTSNDCTTVLVGNFSEMMIGVRTQLKVRVLSERYADALQFGFLCYLRADVQLAHAASFVKVVGVR